MFVLKFCIIFCIKKGDLDNNLIKKLKCPVNLCLEGSLGNMIQMVFFKHTVLQQWDSVNTDGHNTASSILCT